MGLSKNQNQSINLLKGIACIAVVFIHVPFPGVFGQLVIALARSGVALFFVISGFYLYQDENKDVLKALPQKIKRTAKLTIIAFSIYLVWESFVRLVGGGVEKVIGWYTSELFTFNNLLKIVFTSYDPVVGHLWFLVALLESYMIFWCMLKANIKIYSLPALTVLEIHIMLMAFSHINDLKWDMTIFRSVWFYGFPFMVLGYCLRKWQYRILKLINTQFLVLIAVIGCVLTLVERFTIGNLQIFNGSLLMLIAIFMLAVKYPGVSEKNCLVRLGSKYSTEIYIYHWIAKEVLIKLQDTLHITHNWFQWIEPIVAFSGTIGTILVVHYLSLIINSRKG